MAVQNVRIKYVVDTSELDKADRSIDKMTASEKQLKEEFDKVNASAKRANNEITDGSKKAASSTNSLAGSVKSLGQAVLASFAIERVVSFANKIIEVRGEFQKLEAVLTNTLGSQSAAQKALSDINTFAAKTNFGVVELTNSFVKLANQGFTPTIDELGNLADLANSTGKSFDQLTEAIIDAQTGEFERLKEFGIRASKEGDNVKFTFKGVETQTRFTATAIRDYVLALGDLNGVQGSTEAISRTLVGQMSNLGDNFDQLFNTIGQGTEGILTDFISALNDSVALANTLLQTQEQLGKQQRQNSDNRLEEQAKVRLNDRLEIDFLLQRKNTDAAYAKSFVENRSEQQKAEFEMYKNVSANRKTAAADVISDLQSQLDNYRQFTVGMSISATNAFQNSLQDQLNAAIKYYGELEAAEKKAEEAKNKPKTQKDLDEEYKKQLALLKEREQNAIREAKVNEMSKVYILDIERQFNEKRVGLFKQYNQQNLEELKGYNIRFLELEKERQDAIIENNIEFQKLESQKVDTTQGTDKLILGINENTVLEKKRKYDEDVANHKKAEEAKREVTRAVYSGLLDLYTTFQQNQQIATQNQIQSNNLARQQELQQYEGNKQAQATINAKFDSMNRRLQREQAQRDKEAALFNIGIGTAQAVVKALPNFILAGVVAGFGALQAVAVASRPLPKFAKGVEKLEGEGTETSDSIHAMLSKGERVVPASTNKDYYPALTAIHNRHIPPELINGFAMNYGAIQGGSTVVINDNSKVESKLDKIASKMDSLKQVNVNIDKSGVHAFLETKYSRTEFVNNYVTK